MSSRVKNQFGTTLVELSVAMLISSIVITGAYQAYEYVTKSTERENQKALILKDIVSTTERVGKDIRMAGNGLPGNGIRVSLNTDQSDVMELFYNDNLTKAKPASNVGYSDTKLYVDNCTGATNGGYVCIAGSGLDTIYCKVLKVGNNPTGVDTLYLGGQVGAGTFVIASTDLYYCKRIAYTIESVNNDRTLTLSIDSRNSLLGGHLDTLNITPKNKAGTVLASGFENTSMIEVLVGGYVGKGANRVMISESIQVNIRNK